MKKLKRFLIGTSLLAVAACSNPNTGKNSLDSSSINAGAILSDQKLSPSQKAEKLAEASEQLFTVQGFESANEIADLALGQDPKNFKAQFIKTILGPVMVQKGILSRVKPLAEKDPKTLDRYNRELSKFAQEFPDSPIKSLLLDGSPDISSEAEVQAYLENVAGSFKAVREFAKSHKTMPLEMMASDTFYNALMGRWAESCQVSQSKTYEYKWACPSKRSLMKVSFNQADFEVIQEVAAGNELYFSLANSYDLSGAIQTLINHRSDSSVSASKILNELLSNSKFGVLRAEHGFTKIKAMGVDAIAAIRWIIDNQKSLCPMGTADGRNRVGFLMSRGLCLQESPAVTAAHAQKAEDILNGASFQTTVGNGHNSYQTTVVAMDFVQKPLADIRNLGEIQFNKCNQVTSIGDQTGAGLLPQADANTILQIGAKCN